MVRHYTCKFVCSKHVCTEWFHFHFSEDDVLDFILHCFPNLYKLFAILFVESTFSKKNTDPQKNTTHTTMAKQLNLAIINSISGCYFHGRHHTTNESHCVKIVSSNFSAHLPLHGIEEVAKFDVDMPESFLEGWDLPCAVFSFHFTHTTGNCNSYRLC